MHDLLKKYTVNGLHYIDKNELIDALKRVDNAYYIDDLNYLTLPSNVDCLCGYFPGTIPERNFCYVRLINKNWQVDPDNPELLMPNGCVISCRDLDVAERFLDLFYEHRFFKKYFLNLPAKFEGTEQSEVEALLEKYKGYYRLTSLKFDYRFQDLNDIWEDDVVSSNQIESVPQDIFRDDLLTYSDWYVFKKGGKSAFAYGCFKYFHPERIGMKIFSFGNHFHTYENEIITTEEALQLWKFLARKYMKDGYVVKGIAVDDGFDKDEMYLRLGMKQYRCFVTLATDC